MATSFTVTGSYSNLTRKELEQLRRADFFAGSKALTVGDSGLAPEGVVGVGSVNAEPYQTLPSLFLQNIYPVTPPTQPAYGVRRLVQLAGTTSDTVSWYGPTQTFTGTTGFASLATEWTDSSAAGFAGVAVNDLLVINTRDGASVNNSGVVATITAIVGNALTVSNIRKATGAPGVLDVDPETYSYVIVRANAVRLFAVPGSGPLGREQTFLTVTPGSTLNANPSPSLTQINADRVLNLVSPFYATGDRADALFGAPDTGGPGLPLAQVGYRVILYKSNFAGTGPDLTAPIVTLNPVIDSTIPAADQRMTFDFQAGVVRFSCAPRAGDDIKLGAGGVDPVTGRLSLFAVFWAVDLTNTTTSAPRLYVPRSTLGASHTAARFVWDETDQSWNFFTIDATEVHLSGPTPDTGVRLIEHIESNTSVLHKINARQEVTCGDGVISFGDFNGPDAIDQAYAYWVTHASSVKSLVIYAKAGSYTCAAAFGTDSVTTFELTLRGDGRAATLVNIDSAIVSIGVAPLTKVTVENLTLSTTGSGGIIYVGGSIQATECFFNSVLLNITDGGAFLQGGIPTPVATFDRCEFGYVTPLAGFDSQLHFEAVGTKNGCHWKNCTFTGNPDGYAILKYKCSGGTAGTWVDNVFSHCTFKIYTQTQDTSTTLAKSSGLVDMDPFGSDLQLTLADITFEQCAVSVVIGNGGTCQSLLHLFPVKYDATDVTSRTIIGTVTIRGGVWDVSQEGVDTDFAPFFLMAAKPIVEDLTLLSTGAGQGVYTTAMWQALIGLSVGADNAPYFATVAASGAALLSPTSSPTALPLSLPTGLSVRGLTITNVYRRSGAGDLALVGPGMDGGPVVVDGVHITCTDQGITGNTTPNIPKARVFLRPGGVGATKGSHGVFRDITWQATQDLPAFPDAPSNFLLVLGGGGDLHVEGVRILPRQSGGYPIGNGSLGYGIDVRDQWVSGLTGGHLRFRDAYVENMHYPFSFNSFDTVELDSLESYVDLGGTTPSHPNFAGILINAIPHPMRFTASRCRLQIEGLNPSSSYLLYGFEVAYANGEDSQGVIRDNWVRFGTVADADATAITTGHINVTTTSLDPNLDCMGNTTITDTQSSGTISGNIHVSVGGVALQNPVTPATGASNTRGLETTYTGHRASGGDLAWNYGVLRTP